MCSFFNNIKNNDYDCVIMSHDQFGKIPQSPELAAAAYCKQKLDTVEENLEVLRQQGKTCRGRCSKGLEKRKHNLEAKLEKVDTRHRVTHGRRGGFQADGHRPHLHR